MHLYSSVLSIAEQQVMVCGVLGVSLHSFFNHQERSLMEIHLYSLCEELSKNRYLAALPEV